MSAEKVSHTPGPWRVTGCLDLWVEPVGAPDDGTFHGIAHCGDIHWPDYEAKQTEWEANARLIASAPTLAAELAKLREWNRVLSDALTEAICLIGSLNGQDNSCDPMTDISELQSALDKGRAA